MNYLRFNNKQEPELCELNIKTNYYRYTSSLVKNKFYSIYSCSNYSCVNDKLPYIYFYDDGELDYDKIPPNEIYLIDGEKQFGSPIIVKLSSIGRILYKNGDFIGYNYCFTSLTSKDVKQIEKHITKCN